MKMKMKGLTIILVLAMSVSCTLPSPLQRGFEALEEEDYATAETEFNVLLRNDPNNPFGLLNMGVVYQNTNRVPEAVDLYRKAEIAGANVYPAQTTGDVTAQQSLGQIARQNLTSLGY